MTGTATDIEHTRAWMNAGAAQRVHIRARPPIHQK
jgi:hypothetical protein